MRGSYVNVRSAMSVALAIAILGCNSASKSTHPSDSSEPQKRHAYTGGYPIQVMTTTGMVADLVRNVGGQRVAVGQLMGEGVDPHLYKPSPGDVSQLNRAEMVFYSGLHLEGKMADVLERLRNKKPAVAVAERIPADRRLQVSADLYDPHVWFDVALWSEAVAAIEETLASFDAKNAEEYHERAAAYRQELAELDEECRTRISRIPESRRVLVTAHDAFHYFGRAYGMEVKAIQGVSTQAEAGIKQINELVDFISERGIKAVFVETSVSERNIEALVEGCRARGHRVAIGGQLFSDAMGRPETPGGTYPGMVRHNVNAIVEALE